MTGRPMRGNPSRAQPGPMTTTTAPRQSLGNDSSSAEARPVSLPRLYFLRLGYLVIAVGIALTKWPLLVNHPQPWPLFEGVVTSMLVALSLLWFLGVRYPLKMLPVLLFELGWKLIWTATVVLPLWRARSAGCSHAPGVLRLPGGPDRGRRHPLALCGHSVRDGARRPVALPCHPQGQ